jgi:hypothetical protein
VIILNQEQRQVLKQHFSNPESNPNIKKLQSMGGRFILVGDISTKFFIENKIPFEVCVVDYKTERSVLSEDDKKIIDSQQKNRQVLKIENPAGAISNQAIDLVKKWVKDKIKLFVIVEGEEDLVAVPFFFLAPATYYVVYGLKDLGMVTVELTDDFKEKLKKEMKMEI